MCVSKLLSYIHHIEVSDPHHEYRGPGLVHTVSVSLTTKVSGGTAHTSAVGGTVSLFYIFKPEQYNLSFVHLSGEYREFLLYFITPSHTFSHNTT